MHLSFSEVQFSLSPPRNYVVFAIFLGLQSPRLWVPQMHTEWEDKGADLQSSLCHLHWESTGNT